ncbi:MAG: hypothetical protein M0P69_18795 [Bacteroidales bacterium]|nr:hypothetical protein [Bacteroidales bacterium]
MRWIGNRNRDPSFNAIASRRMPLIPPAEIVKRPVWLTRDIAVGHRPPSYSGNGNAVRDSYNDGVEACSAGAVFYKYRTPMISYWHARVFCWIKDDYQDILDAFGADWFKNHEPWSTTPEHALGQLWGTAPADVE